MQRKSLFRPALLAAGVAVLALAAFGVVQNRGSAVAAGGAAIVATGAMLVGAGRPDGVRHEGWGFGGHGDGSCVMWDGRADQLVRYLEGELRLSSEQQGPWNKLVETIRTESKSWEEVCRSFPDGEATNSLVWELAFVESLMKAGAASAGKLRVAYGAFDETLSPEQRATVDSLLAARHGHARSRGRRHFGGWH